MPNFPGSSGALPGVYTRVVTLSRGVSIPGGVRLAALLGEGSRVEDLIVGATGSGNDGLNSDYTSTVGRDGRHFALSLAPVVSNRTTIYKNGVPLTLTEDTIDTDPFDSRFDARIEIATGHIELQGASLVDQGGAYYSASSANVGTGTIGTLTLEDTDAPTETWTVRCSSVRRDGYGDPISGYAKFVVQGSVSGVLLDGYGNQITWQSDGVVVSNGVLSFAITEGGTTFVEGDRFTIQVKGGTLVRGDNLTVTYIAEIDINDIEFFTDMPSLTAKHGSPSLTNRLSLGAQLAFANGPPGIYTLQTAPSIPRRVSYILEDDAAGATTLDDFTFPLEVGVLPDTDSNINFFITDPATGVESQVIPNKVTFFDAGITASPSSFVFGAGYTYSYTVILQDAVRKKGNDGVLTSFGATATLSSASDASFNTDELGATMTLRIYDSANPANDGTYTITDVTDGVLTIGSGAFVTESSIKFEVLDSSVQNSTILFTDDIAIQAGGTVRATIVDNKDASFFDVGWITALEELEKIECDIVVPLPSQTLSQVFQNTRLHCETMSNIKNRRERVMFSGAISGLAPENVIGTEAAAVEDIGVLEGIQGDDISEILAGDTEDLTDYGVSNSFGDTFRVVYFYPDEIVVQIGADRTLIDGFFIAAAAAGFLSGVPNVAVPLTNKVLSGFTILRDKVFRPIILEQLTTAGIAVLQPVIGGGRVLHGRTTTQSGYVEEQEISIVFIRDRVAKTMRAGFQAFIGQAESPTLQGSLISRATGILNGLISQGLITQYADLTVKRDSVDPTQWNISVHVQPTYPVNFVYIEISIGLL
jgi:hypothetical protein